MAFPQFIQPHTVIAPGAASREAASAGARAEAAAAGRPQSGKLVFSIQKQLQTQWCWAAVSTSVSLYFNRSSTWTQCTVANKNLKRSDCCGSPSNCNTPSVLVAADPDESQYLYISDPIYLDSRVALDEFPSAYQGGGDWTHTYLTDRPRVALAAADVEEAFTAEYPNAIGA